MGMHLMLSSAGSLKLHSSGHLRLKHPGYVTTLQTTSQYYAYVQDYYLIPYEDPMEPKVIPYVRQQALAAIAAMVSSGSGTQAELEGGYYPAGGQYYSVFAWSKPTGLIYSVTANDGADFGNPLCDLTVTVTGSNTGSAGALLVSVGSGSTCPSGNPISWGGTPLSATTTFPDFTLSPYLWLSCWFSSTDSVTSASLDRTCSASISLANVRYAP